MRAIDYKELGFIALLTAFLAVIFEIGPYLLAVLSLLIAFTFGDGLVYEGTIP